MIFANIDNPETWLSWTERYGFPLVALVAIAFVVVWGVWAAWSFSKPLINRVAESFMGLIEKQSEFIDKVSVHQDELKTLVQFGQGGHEKTHEKLDTIGKRTEEIHRAVLDKRVS